MLKNIEKWLRSSMQHRLHVNALFGSKKNLVVTAGGDSRAPFQAAGYSLLAALKKLDRKLGGEVGGQREEHRQVPAQAQRP